MVIRLADCAPEPTAHGNPKQVLLRGGTLPNVTQVAVATFEGETETELHTHPTMYEVYFVLEGRAVYTIGEEETEVGPGDFFYVPPGVAHRQRVTAGPHRIFYWGIATARGGLKPAAG
jgi:quercetin dioxygenase-like cupin family protein